MGCPFIPNDSINWLKDVIIPIASIFVGSVITYFVQNRQNTVNKKQDAILKYAEIISEIGMDFHEDNIKKTKGLIAKERSQFMVIKNWLSSETILCADNFNKVVNKICYTQAQQDNYKSIIDKYSGLKNKNEEIFNEIEKDLEKNVKEMFQALELFDEEFEKLTGLIANDAYKSDWQRIKDLPEILDNNTHD